MNAPPTITAAVVALMAFVGGAAVAGFPDEPSSLRVTSEVTVPSSTTVPADPSTAAPADPSTTAPASTAPATTAPATDAVEADTAPDRSTVSVVVANAARIDGLALEAASRLLTVGYRFVVAADALDQRDTTAVLFSPGNRASAERLAADLGLPVDVVAPLSDEPLTDGPVSADVVVLLAGDVDL